MTDRAFTIRDLTERYGVGEHTVLGWIRSGELRALNCGRRPGAKKPRWRVTAEAITAFEVCRTHLPPLPKTRRRKQSTNVIAFY